MFNLMKEVGEKMGKAHKKIAITMMIGALSFAAFGCEAEKKAINPNATQESKEEQIDPVVEKQMKTGIRLETVLIKGRWQRVMDGFTMR